MIVNLIDGSNIFFICFAMLQSIVSKEQDRDLDKDDIPQLMSMVMMKLKLFLDQKNNIVCFEGKDSTKWRKSIYPQYKGNRNYSSKSFEILGEAMGLCQETLSSLPCKVMKVDNCEGDDCIFTLSDQIARDTASDIEIISTDEDLTQIANFIPGRVKVMHPVKKEYRTVNPDILRVKTFVGDGSDNIKFKKGLGPKTLVRMEESKEVYDKFVRPDDYSLLESIHRIVDLRCFPLEYRQKIAEAYNSTPFAEWNEAKFNSYIDDESTRQYVASAMKYRERRTAQDSYIEQISVPSTDIDTSDVLDLWAC